MLLIEIDTFFVPDCVGAGFETKKVTKPAGRQAGKNQDKPDRSARFVLPTPHITLRIFEGSLLHKSSANKTVNQRADDW
jgi:hypothetical protein